MLSRAGLVLFSGFVGSSRSCMDGIEKASFHVVIVGCIGYV